MNLASETTPAMRERERERKMTMADWFYYGNNGKKVGPISGGELLQLAKQGTITPETLVEDPGGRVHSAVNVKGMKFLEKIQSPEPNPFTAVPPIAKNPFTAPLPEDNSEPDEEEADRISLWVPIAGVLLVLAVCVIGWWVIFPDKLNETVKQGLNKDVIPNSSLEITDLVVKWSDKSAGSAEFTMKSKATENLYQLEVDRKIALQQLGITDTFEAEFDTAMRKYHGLRSSYQSSLRTPKDLSLLRFYGVLVPMGDEVTLSGSVKLTKDSNKKWQIAEFLVSPFSHGGRSFYGEEFKPGSKLGEDEHRLDASQTKDAVSAIIQDRKTFAAEIDKAVLQQQQAIDEENARFNDEERERLRLKQVEAAKREQQRQAALKENFGKLRGLAFDGNFTFTLSGTTLNDRVSVVFENSANSAQDTINGKITFIGVQSSLERPFTVNLNTTEGAEYPVTGIIDNRKLPFGSLDELIRLEIGPRWPTQGERNYYNAPFTLITGYRNIGIQFTDVMSFSLRDNFGNSIRLNISSRQATSFKNLAQFDSTPGQTTGPGGGRTSQPPGVVSLMSEMRKNGCNNYYDLRDFVQYGSATLKSQKIEADRVLANVDKFDDAGRRRAEAEVASVQARIKIAQDEIAKKTFFHDYSYSERSSSNLGEGNSSFEMAIDNDNIKFPFKTVNVSFPQDLKVTGTVVREWLDLSIRGDTTDIGKLVNNKINYRVRIWFTNLRSTGGYRVFSSAEVEKIEIIKVQ